jgi:hypothetical protein
MSARDRLTLLGDRADPLTRWQAEAEMRAEAEAREREAEERERRRERAESEQVQELRSEIAVLRQELANVEVRLAERDEKFLDIVDQLATGLDKVEAWATKAIEARVTRLEAEMCAKVAESFGELLGRLKALDPTLARAARGEPFRFANEKADSHDEPVIDLPNWRRGNGTVVN